MIKFTVFDPLKGTAISYGTCSHEEDVWHQPQEGQGFVAGHMLEGWASDGVEGFVRDGDGFLRTHEWLDKYWPLG